MALIRCLWWYLCWIDVCSGIGTLRWHLCLLDVLFFGVLLKEFELNKCLLLA